MLSSRYKTAISFTAAIALVLAADHWLYGTRWFLRHYGFGTQEGQIVAKMGRASLQASVADVIFLGSSTIRSNISSKPFLERGVLPLNLGVSGGGPLYCYHALKRIAPAIALRSTKPLLVLEVAPLALVPSPSSSWSEWEHLFAMVRTRSELAGEFPLLLSNFRSYDMTSLFLSTAALPSFMYRVQGRSVANLPVSQLRTIIADGYDTNGSYFGYDDLWGFAPQYGVISDVVEITAPIAKVVEAKREFLFMTISLARQLGMPVVLIESSASYGGLPPPELYAAVRERFPEVRTISLRECGFRPGDFQDAHLNIWGADRFAERLLGMLELTGDAQRLDGKIRATADRIGLPPASQWRLLEAVALADASDPHVIALAKSGGALLPDAVSPAIAVTPGAQYVFEFQVSGAGGRVGFEVAPAAPSGRPAYNRWVAWTPERLQGDHGEARFFLRFTPRAHQAVLRLLDDGHPDGARVRVVSLYRQR